MAEIPVTDTPWEPVLAGNEVEHLPDLIREAVDGMTGEDPPRGWRPRS
jgi:hypothetical protein